MRNLYNPSSNAFKYENRTKPNPIRKKTQIHNKDEPAITKVILVGLIITSIGMFLFVSTNYLKSILQQQAQLNEIKELEYELHDLQQQNYLKEHEINASINYLWIYDMAVNELGMIYPEKSNTIYYEHGESEYVNQYMDIPKE